MPPSPRPSTPLPQSVPVPSLADVLSNAVFPARHADLLRQYGDLTIQRYTGERMRLDVALRCIGQPDFKSVSDLLLALEQLTRPPQSQPG